MDELLERLDTLRTQAPDAPVLAAFGRVWRYRELDARVTRMAAAFARLGVGPERPLGLLLPAVPTAAMAALAGFRLGATVVPCDPMSPEPSLRARLRQLGDGVLVTLDLTRLQQRWLHHLDETGLHAVVVDKMAELLPFPRNLLMPLLRGGEIAALPRDPRAAALPTLMARTPEPAPETRPAACIREADTGVWTGEALSGAVTELLHLAGGGRRWLFAHALDGAWPLAALLAPLSAGRESIVLPRLDARTLTAALAHEQPQVAVLSAKAAETLIAQPPASPALGLAVVPPDVPEETRDALAEALDARVVVWAGAFA